MDRVDASLADPQHSLFGTGDDRLSEQARPAEAREVRCRRKLTGVVERVRAAETMPLTPRQIRMWRTVPTMSNCLPESEARGVAGGFRARGRAAFRRLRRRLRP